MSEEESPITTGDVIRQRFEVRRSLGSGGYGVVFEVWDREAQEQCAIKVGSSEDQGLGLAKRLFAGRGLPTCRQRAGSRGRDRRHQEAAEQLTRHALQA